MDRDGDIRRLVCQGLVALVQTVPERLQSNMAPIVQYVLARNQARRQDSSSPLFEAVATD